MRARHMPPFPRFLPSAAFPLPSPFPCGSPPLSAAAEAPFMRLPPRELFVVGVWAWLPPGLEGEVLLSAERPESETARDNKQRGSMGR